MKENTKANGKTNSQAKENMNRIITGNTKSIIDRLIEKKIKERKP